MVNDIKNTVKIIQYPRINIGDEVSEDMLLEMIKQHMEKVAPKFLENLSYYIGNNTGILKKESIDENNPDNRITVPYARTMTQVIKGYMYKPSLIAYDVEDEQYKETLKEIYDENQEQIKTAEIGEDQSKYGVAFEILFSNTSDNIIEGAKTLPYFAKLPPWEVIPVFYRQLLEKLALFIRYFLIEEDEDTGERVYQVEVYHESNIELYKLTITKDDKFILEQEGQSEHFFQDIPLTIYPNNDEYIADYEPIQNLIDAYDRLVSDSLNELDRFAAAYLILKNYILANTDDRNQKKEILEKLKQYRVFEVADDGEIKFLTKDIPSEFFEAIKQTLREDIEYHSHVPDFRGKSFEAKSGEAQKWALLDFENLASDKQAYAERGLQNRIRLINNFLKIQAVEADKVTIKFERNLPSNDSITIQNVVALKQANLLADEDLIALLPKDMVPDPEAALENLNSQKTENMETFGMMGTETNIEDDDE